jgi:hypothetical protein
MSQQYVPVAPDYIRMQLIRRRRLPDGMVQLKRRRANATPCPDCYGQPKDKWGRYPSCDKCTWGLVVSRERRKLCPCCTGRHTPICENCAQSKATGVEMHVCLVTTDDEVDYEMELELMPAPRRSCASEESRLRRAAMEV